jgi:signal transduction histidine kinase
MAGYRDPLLLAHLSGTLAAIVVLMGLALYLWQFRREPGARWQSYVQVCKGVWLLAVLMYFQSALPAQRNFLVLLYCNVAMLVCYFWLRCIAEISGAERRFAAWFLPTVRGGLFLFFLFTLTNNWHHWYWLPVLAEGGMENVQGGPIGCLAFFMGQALLVYSLWLNVLWIRSSVGLRKRQAWMFALAPIPAWIGQFLGPLSNSQSLEPHSIGFLLTGLIVAWAFYRWRAYSIVPLAQQVALKSMFEGFLIVDDSGYIVEMNEHAQFLFDQSEIHVGSVYDDAVRAWSALAQMENEEVVQNALLVRDGKARYFRIRRTPLQTSPGRILGQLLMFTEMTREKQQQVQILEQQKAIAILQERGRLGRELHDGPGQMWSFVAAQTQAVRLYIAKQKYEQADCALEELQQIIRGSCIELRESITGLQTSVDGNLLKTLDEQLRWYRVHCGLQTEMRVQSSWRDGMISPYVEMQILRILQEALANVRKSAHASRILLLIAQEPDGLLFQVEDDGQGFDPTLVAQRIGHYGLKIMQERSHEIGARLDVESKPGAGCRISLLLPETQFIVSNERGTSDVEVAI